MSNTGKTLIVYYSRTGTCRKVAEALQKELAADLDEVTYANGKHISFFGGVIEAIGRKTAPIDEPPHNPADYDRIICIAPVWGSGLATPMRSYLQAHKDAIRSYGMIAVCGGSGGERLIAEAAALVGKAAAVSAVLTAGQVNKGNYDLTSFK